ncbi:MAG: glycosyltransferase [Pygmaiobacter sp.]|nr:glycosyltransferase [Pygmaiobacter sp.]
MRVHLYTGSLQIVAKSGVGQAIFHQKAMLEKSGVEVTEHWRGHADAVHINTVFPDAVLAALRAKLRGEMVAYYGHSTMQDFRNSFVGSNLLAPLFKKWICFCYGLGDVIITPTPYSKRLLESYGIEKPITALSNGIDTDFFAPSEARRKLFREKYGLTDTQKVVISVGHYMERKGILDFIALAQKMPEVRFYWFGYTAPALVPEKIKAAMAAAPENLCFAGYCNQADLRDAYCGADAFVFCSLEETEGIVVLEALASGAPMLVRDIPVYADWLQDGKNSYKAATTEEFKEKLCGILNGTLPDCTAAGHRVAEARSVTAMGQKLCALYENAESLSPVYAF